MATCWLAFFAILFPILRFTLDRLVFAPFGRFVLSRLAKKKDIPFSESKLYKWKESCWKCLVYFSFTVLATFCSIRENFFYDTRYFWLGCTAFPPCNYYVSPWLRLFYALELGFYVQAIPSLCFWEVRRKDFWESFAHHIATVGLIVYSYQVNFVKVGVMVFLCHDVNDIFLEGAKLARYADRSIMSNVLFIAFMLSWFASRIVYFPLWVIRSVIFEPITLVANVYGINPHPHWEIFMSLLLFLFALHLYWSYLIVLVVIKQFRDGQAEDIREDDDDD
eukprot:jgi/Botrbrau1/13433/Bobra.0082s0037.1